MIIAEFWLPLRLFHLWTIVTFFLPISFFPFSKLVIMFCRNMTFWHQKENEFLLVVEDAARTWPTESERVKEQMVYRSIDLNFHRHICLVYMFLSSWMTIIFNSQGGGSPVWEILAGKFEPGRCRDAARDNYARHPTASVTSASHARPWTCGNRCIE